MTEQIHTAAKQRLTVRTAGVAFALALLLLSAPAGSAAIASEGQAPSTPPPSPNPTESSAATGEAPAATVTPKTRTRLLALPSGNVSDPTRPLRVRLSGPVAKGWRAPMLSPGVPGRWKASGSQEIFEPAAPLAPCTAYTLTIWGSTVATGELPLAKRRTLTLQVACPSTLALQQSLARLRYLPFELRSKHRIDTYNSRESAIQVARYAYHPPRGPFAPYIPYAPGLWYGALDPTTRGALMVFQLDNNLPVSGSPDARTWAALLSDETHARSDPKPYTFVTVSERIPETLQVHEGRHLVLSTPVNTGVPGAATQLGTFPIYARYVSTTMSGTNPDGSHYSDPGVPWVNYFNGGDAVHGFPRPSYGTPQSNGCVELPIGTSAEVYSMLSLGDLVIVSG
jgi:peptidoglycan hydrolase-like protein with peptidoglycan-binding domain